MKKEERKQLRAFGWASFLNDLGADMISPIWPLFLSVFLGASTVIIGLIDGIGDSIVSLSQFFSGYLSDRIRKRKVFIWLGYLFSSLSKAGYALASFWPQIIPLRILDRGGKIRDAPRDAIVADISNHKDRGRNFGFIETMDRAGAVAGVILSIILFQFIGFKPLFLLAAIPPFIAFLLIAALVKEKAPKKLPKVTVSLKDIDHNFRFFLFINAIFAISAFSYSFLLIAAKDIGFSLTIVPVLYLIYNLFASISSIPFGKLADKIGRRPVLIISFILWALVSIIFIFTSSLVSIALAFCVYGLHKGALEPSQRTMVSEMAPKKYKATALGIFKMITGICALPASLFAGLLWAYFGMDAPFYFSLVLTIIAILLVLTFNENHSKS